MTDRYDRGLSFLEGHPMSPSPDRVISINLSDDVWRAFTQVQPEPVSWLKSRILETIEAARAGSTDTPQRLGRA
jgi:hypothetical protein